VNQGAKGRSLVIKKELTTSPK